MCGVGGRGGKQVLGNNAAGGGTEDGGVLGPCEGLGDGQGTQWSWSLEGWLVIPQTDVSCPSRVTGSFI